MFKKITKTCCVCFCLLMVWHCQAIGETFKVFENYSGTWQDANKTWDDDSNMCWAAAASNILKWSRWDVAAYNTGDLIFNQFRANWYNVGGEVPWGYDWWFRGTSYLGAVTGGGNYWPSRNPWSILHTGAGNQLQLVDTYLRSGYGVTLSVQNVSTAIRHAMTVWGFDYNPSYDSSDNHYYTHLYVTDSDDNMVELRRLEVSSEMAGYWYFTDPTFSGYKIWAAEGFERRWIPEFAPEGITIDAEHRFNKLFLLEPFLSFDYKWEPPFPVPQPGDPFEILIKNAGQWQTLYETALGPNDVDWRSLNIEIPLTMQGLHEVCFLFEGQGSVSLYRLAPVPIPSTFCLFGSGLAVLLGLMGRKRRELWKAY